MAVLLEQPHMTIERCTVLNPSTLMPTETDGEPHNCLLECRKVAKPRPDLQDDPIPGSILFMWMDQARSLKLEKHSGYAVAADTETLKAEPLHPQYSAQAAEIIALTEACKQVKQLLSILTARMFTQLFIYLLVNGKIQAW